MAGAGEHADVVAGVRTTCWHVKGSADTVHRLSLSSTGNLVVAVVVALVVVVVIVVVGAVVAIAIAVVVEQLMQLHGLCQAKCLARTMWGEEQLIVCKGAQGTLP